MNKKILVGSIFVLTLLLLMPSIPAVQQKSIGEGIKQEIQEKLDTINLNDLKESKKLDWVRHPLLCVIILYLSFIVSLRIGRGIKLRDSSYGYAPDGHRIIVRPFRFFRGKWIISRGVRWFNFWENLSDTLHWNWWDHSYLLDQIEGEHYP